MIDWTLITAAAGLYLLVALASYKAGRNHQKRIELRRGRIVRLLPFIRLNHRLNGKHLGFRPHVR
jgi:hypothetical protein